MKLYIPILTIQKKMMKAFLLINALLFSFFFSCKKKSGTLVKHILNEEDRHIGDSIFINGLIHKIVFIDTTYYVDSIVFSRFSNFDQSIKSVSTYENGRTVYENIDYYENGGLKKYSFIDEDNDAYRYTRNYDIDGNLIATTGYLFFQVFISNADSLTGIDYKKGVSTRYKIYYPNPPDCNVNLYIKLEGGALYDVFSKSRFLSFLQTMSHDNSKKGTYRMDFVLELKDGNKDISQHYTKSLIYRVVD